MKNIFRNLIAFIVLFGLIYFVTNNYGTAQQLVGVKGASTQKAQEVTKAINSDINKQVDATIKKTEDVKVSDIIQGLSRFQKIPKDINNIKEYVTEQVNNFTKKKKG